MGCTCATPAEPPPELVGIWARDPYRSLQGLHVARRNAYARVRLGFVPVELGAPNEVLEIPPRGIVRHVETLGGGSYNLWTGPVREWNALGSLGGGEYATTTCCFGTLEQVGKAQLASGQPWFVESGEAIRSIEINGKTRLYRVPDTR